MTDLDKLIVAVNSDRWADRRIVLSVFGGQAQTALNAYNGSLDAALALHKAMLPGWIWEKRGGELVVQHWDVEYSHTDHDNPARAWLLAILLALSPTSNN